MMVNYYRRQRAEKELKKHQNLLEKTVEERTKKLSITNRALVDSENKFRTLSDAAFEEILITATGKIIEANSFVSHDFGYQIYELIGLDAVELIVPEERERANIKVLAGSETLYETLGLKFLAGSSALIFGQRCSHTTINR